MYGNVCVYSNLKSFQLQLVLFFLIFREGGFLLGAFNPEKNKWGQGYKSDSGLTLKKKQQQIYGSKLQLIFKAGESW